jgi:hypothetical protein
VRLFVFVIFTLSTHFSRATPQIECTFKRSDDGGWQAFSPKQKDALYQETAGAKFFFGRPCLSQELCAKSNTLQTVVYATRLNGNTAKVEGWFRCCFGPFRYATLMRKNLVLAKLEDQELYFYQTLWQVSYGSKKFLLPQGLLPESFFKVHFKKLPHKSLLVCENDRERLSVPPMITLSPKDLPCSRRAFKLKQTFKEVLTRAPNHCPEGPSSSKKARKDGAYRHDRRRDAPPPNSDSDTRPPKT